MPDKADWPVPANNSLPLKCLFRVAGHSCTWKAFSAWRADVLLHFVQHHQRRGNLPSTASAGFDGRGHLFAGDVGDLGELLFNELGLQPPVWPSRGGP